MNKLEKLKSIRDAFYPLIKNHSPKGCRELDDAMLRLQELIAEEEIKDTLLRNPTRLAFPILRTATLFVDGDWLCSLSDEQRAAFWKSKSIQLWEKSREKDVLEAALKLKEEIIKNAANDSSPFETFCTIYNTISSQNSAKEKKS